MNKKTNTILTKTPMVCLLAMICCLLWGSAFPCIKIGYQLFQIHPDSIGSQLLFAGCRFTLAGILTILIGSLLNRRFLLPAKTSWSMVAKLGLVQTVLQYILFYIGLANTTGVKSSIIEASNVFLAILAATLIFKLEKLTPAKIAGCILGFAGVVIINLNGGSLDTSMSFSGEGCILLSAAAYALSSILIKRYAQKDEPVTLSVTAARLNAAISAIWMCVPQRDMPSRFVITTSFWPTPFTKGVGNAPFCRIAAPS